MSQTFDDSHPLFDIVVEGVRKVVDAIAYAIENDLPSVDILDPEGDYNTIRRVNFMSELKPALAFFKGIEYYEDCAVIHNLLTIMENEPNVEQIIRTITDSYNDNSTSHDA